VDFEFALSDQAEAVTPFTPACDYGHNAQHLDLAGQKRARSATPGRFVIDPFDVFQE
jgi:hypothetical protein